MEKSNEKHVIKSGGTSPSEWENPKSVIISWDDSGDWGYRVMSDDPIPFHRVQRIMSEIIYFHLRDEWEYLNK